MLGKKGGSGARDDIWVTTSQVGDTIKE